MLGLMQSQPLLISNLIDFAARHRAKGQIVSRMVDGSLHRYTYRDLALRSKQCANVLDAMGLKLGDRVASIAWNTYRHMELYFGVSGSGRIMHTINPRMHPTQVTWVINHAQDQVVFFDSTFLPIVQAVHGKCPTVKHWVLLGAANEPPKDSGIPHLESYEALMHKASADYAWPVLDENSASGLCYTSGTTGDPKGVMYSHRSTVLHAYAGCLPDALGTSANDCVLVVVPMFHVNAWGIPFGGALTGAKLVLPGPAMDGKSLYELMESEGVTLASGVPTIWQRLLEHLEQNHLKFSTLRSTNVGGSACPAGMIRTFMEDYGVEVVHAWGMTETSPLGTVSRLTNEQLELPPDDQMAIRIKQGRAVFGVDMKIVGDDGKELPWDGKTFGELLVRGPWIAESYFGGKDPCVRDAEGHAWFPTGDVATIDPDGFMQITDRSKDVIKSGGEWISSIAIENIAMGHPAVAMAACIGIHHPKWDERPIVVVVKKPGVSLTREEVLALYQGKLAKWQIPDDVVFVDEIPLGATGKMQKLKLREQLKDYKLPEA